MLAYVGLSCGQCGPNLGLGRPRWPRWANIAPRWAHIALKIGQHSPKMGQHSPKRGRRPSTYPAFYSVFLLFPFFGSFGSTWVNMGQHRPQDRPTEASRSVHIAFKIGQHSPKRWLWLWLWLWLWFWLLFVCLFGWLVGWFVGWLVGWLFVVCCVVCCCCCCRCRGSVFGVFLQLGSVARLGTLMMCGLWLVLCSSWFVVGCSSFVVRSLLFVVGGCC